jgi:hypothetical protein
MHSAKFGKAAAGVTLAIVLASATVACSPAPTSSPTADRGSGPALTLTALTLTSLMQGGADRAGVERASAERAGAVNAAGDKGKVPAPALKTFTFPDGHISFAYPANWSLRTQPGPTLPGGPTECLEVVLSDHRGRDVAFIVSGFFGDGAAGPVDRTVFDSAPVPGLAAVEGEPTFGFFRDSYVDVNDHFYLDIRPAAELVSGNVNSGTGQVPLPNGAAIFRVYMYSPGFPSAEAARAWMETAEYAQLKALLMSVAYS